MKPDWGFATDTCYSPEAHSFSASSSHSCVCLPRLEIMFSTIHVPCAWSESLVSIFVVLKHWCGLCSSTWVLSGIMDEHLSQPPNTAGSFRDPWQNNDDDTESYFQLNLYFLNRFLVARKCRTVWVGRDLKDYVAFMVTVLRAFLVKCCALEGIKALVPAVPGPTQESLCNTSSCGLENIMNTTIF